MTEFRADLHTHTTSSDGSLTPSELVAAAVQANLSGLSITDHDTVDSYQEAIPAAAKLGLELLSGVEFTARDGRESVHILGYGFELEDASLRAFCARHVIRREERNRQILEKLTQLGLPVSEQELLAKFSFEGKKVYGRPHIAEVMVEKGYVTSLQEAFHEWIGEGKRAYAPGEDVSLQVTIDVIHNAGGRAVIAHPHLLKFPKTVRHIQTLPFDGIEAYYSRFTPASESRWVRLAKEKGWITTGGSDFHGAAKPRILLGCSWVNEEIFRLLQSGRKAAP